ncbi:CRISPR-associated endonuclease Cas1 [Nodularia sp. LEGE 04288]|uniref:CRISPR-associated endonuclease Cas1 n=1 Tax=Nodularia sp. LEGE 04288 TaxID=1828639 RepID=UPI001D123059|nr:CRISPR-associated endonuclease Cas1 [Nodularia sp. LEGE 04288]MCC2694864.1 CRISPR-associated endonuclease Cas1 [Nodularia sp. LEGE 04288]
MAFTIEELRFAWFQVRLGTKNAGVDGITLDFFASMVSDQLQILQHQLQQQIYHTYPAKGFYIPKKSGGKRLVGIPTVRDRIVQRLLLEELYFPLEDTFLDCSYAYRPGHNIQQAVQHLFSYYQLRPTWIIKADIQQFFDNLCWALLFTNLEELKLEVNILELVEQQIKAGVVIGGKTIFSGKGVLQGAVLSGALANLYLTEFDRLCLSHGVNLVRYGDDFAIACESWLQANRILEQITNWLRGLYLSLQPEKTQIYAPDDEFTFLGYRFVNGEVYAPPPPEIKNGKWLINDSGTPYFRLNQRPAKFVSRPPKACSTVKPVAIVPAPISHYWINEMSTLYVTDQGAYLNVYHQQFQVLYKGELKLKIPVVRVSHIVLFGCCNLSHGAVASALRSRIPVMYLSQRGKYFGRLETEGQAKVEYLARQVECCRNPEFTRKQAEAIVLAKLHNSRALLLKFNRRRPSKSAALAITSIAELMEKLRFAESMDALRGYEGKAASLYFQALGSLFTGVFVFERRTKRPPTDPVNSLLSLGYTLLSQNVFSFVQSIGLHTHFGNLHVPRDNHPALVSDLMEEFRAQVVDSFVAYLVNTRILVPEDFTSPDERGGVYLFPDALKKFLKHWEEKLQSEITHPHTGYKVSIRRCIELQVREYISCLMGEVEVYRPMIWKL